MTTSVLVPQIRGAAWYGSRLVADDASGHVWTVLVDAHGCTTCDRCGTSGLGHLTAAGDCRGERTLCPACWPAAAAEPDARPHDMHCGAPCRRTAA
jgi:hypothetical protein